MLRTSGNVPVARIIEDAVHAQDAELPVSGIVTLPSVIRHSNAAARFLSWLSTGFAAFALLLTALGLFGLLSYQVVQRTRELGLRMAVGATRENILLSVVRRGLLLTAAGLALGLAAALALPKLVYLLLAEVIEVQGPLPHTVVDHTTLAPLLSALVLLLAAAVACSLPAWRAAHIDPVEALRAE